MVDSGSLWRLETISRPITGLTGLDRGRFWFILAPQERLKTATGCTSFARATIALLALIFLLPASAFHATLPTNRHTSISQRRTLTPLCQEAAPPPAEFDPEKCTFPGCDGKGRAIGGLGAMKYFEWWPIKVRSVCTPPARFGSAVLICVCAFCLLFHRPIGRARSAQRRASATRDRARASMKSSSKRIRG